MDGWPVLITAVDKMAECHGLMSLTSQFPLVSGTSFPELLLVLNCGTLRF